MALKTGDSVRTRSGKVGTVIVINADRSVVVLFEDEGGRFWMSDLELVVSAAGAAAASG